MWWVNRTSHLDNFNLYVSPVKNETINNDIMPVAGKPDDRLCPCSRSYRHGMIGICTQRHRSIPRLAARNPIIQLLFIQPFLDQQRISWPQYGNTLHQCAKWAGFSSGIRVFSIGRYVIGRTTGLEHTRWECFRWSQQYQDETNYSSEC